LVEVGGQKVALFNVDGHFFAIADTCTHRGGPLSEGSLEGDEVTCPWHGATFNVKTGEASGGPTSKGVRNFKVQVEGADVKIELP
jgi:nitrite reductase/ring-hydroxylating ferredoxin subunit